MSKPTPKDFVTAWQTSSSVKEVAEKLEMKPKTVRSRASYYKKQGVPLKKMKGGRAIDWKKLSNFARTFEEDKNESL